MLVTTSYNKVVAIVPHDTTDVDHSGGQWPDAIYIGGAGTLTVVFEDGSTFQFTCIAGQVLDVKFRRVNSTGTGATLLGAMYQV
jgi:hypothetical protein